MIALTRRDAAKRDIAEVWLWYAENASIDVADRFLAAVESTIQALRKQPRMGHNVEVRLPDLRGMRRLAVFGGFNDIHLFYVRTPAAIELVRVLHAGRNLSRILSESPARS